MKTGFGKLAFLFLVIGCFLCGIVELFYPGGSLSVNRWVWLTNKPSEYYMEVVETRPDGGPWRWAVHIKEDTVQSYLVLEADTHGRPINASWLDPSILTIEQIFLLAEQHCVVRGLLDCGITYDSKYHFPKLIECYEAITVKIDIFLDCSQDPADCSLIHP